MTRAVASATELIQQLAWYINASAVRITVVWHVSSFLLAGGSSGELVNELMRTMTCNSRVSKTNRFVRDSHITTIQFVSVREGTFVSQVSFRSYGDQNALWIIQKSVHLASNKVQLLTFASHHATLPFINVSLYASNMNQRKLITSHESELEWCFVAPVEPSRQRRAWVRHSDEMLMVKVRG